MFANARPDTIDQAESMLAKYLQTSSFFEEEGAFDALGGYESDLTMELADAADMNYVNWADSYDTLWAEVFMPR